MGSRKGKDNRPSPSEKKGMKLNLQWKVKFLVPFEIRYPTLLRERGKSPKLLFSCHAFQNLLKMCLHSMIIDISLLALSHYVFPWSCHWLKTDLKSYNLSSWILFTSHVFGCIVSFVDVQY